MSICYFITGTDTNVGKTVCTAFLAAVALSHGHRVCVYKPVQTGLADPSQPVSDPEQVAEWLGHPERLTIECSYRFNPPVAPLVADPEGTIDLEKIQADFRCLQASHDVVLVEGAGGVAVPFTTEFDTRDLIQHLGIPTIVVARPDLGTINHTRLTLEGLQAKGVPVAGVLVSGYPEHTTDLAVQTLPEVFVQWLSAPVLAWLPRFQSIETALQFPDQIRQYPILTKLFSLATVG
jgi:dethiobiotin synthetase